MAREKKSMLFKVDNEVHGLDIRGMSKLEFISLLFLCENIKSRNEKFLSESTSRENLKKVTYSFSEIKRILKIKSKDETRIPILLKSILPRFNAPITIEGESFFSICYPFNSFNVDIENKTLTININDYFYSLFSDGFMGRYTKVDLIAMSEFKSKYSAYLYFELKKFNASKKVDGSINVQHSVKTWCQILGVDESKEFYYVNQKIIKKSLEECSKYFKGLKVSYHRLNRNNEVSNILFTFEKKVYTEQQKSIIAKRKEVK